jgi:hypothetical protein
VGSSWEIDVSRAYVPSPTSLTSPIWLRNSRKTTIREEADLATSLSHSSQSGWEIQAAGTSGGGWLYNNPVRKPKRKFQVEYI